MKPPSILQVQPFRVGNVLEKQHKISVFIGEIGNVCSEEESTCTNTNVFNCLANSFKSTLYRNTTCLCTDNNSNVRTQAFWNGSGKENLTIFTSAMRRFHTYPKICCIYFLFLRGKLIYLGQTVDLRARMSGGHYFGYLYDSIRYIECPQEKLTEYEKRLIKILKPLVNQQHNKTNPNRITLPFKTPKWATYYDRMLSTTDQMSTGNHPWSKSALQSIFLQSKKKFKYYYKTYGYRGTVLDNSISI